MPSPTIDTERFAALVRERRQGKPLRDLAEDIGDVSPSTLSRVESGKLPDLDTYFKLCRWMGVDPRYFTEGYNETQEEPAVSTPDRIAIHLRADRVLSEEAKRAILTMVRLAYAAELRGDLPNDNDEDD